MTMDRVIRVRMDDELIEKADAVSSQFSWSRSELIRQSLNAFLVNVDGSLDEMQERIDNAQAEVELQK